MDLRSVVVSHPHLGPLTPEEVLRAGSAMITVRARSVDGTHFDVTLGRSRARPAPGRLAAFSSRRGVAGPFRHRALTRAIIDAAIIARAARYEEDGGSYHVFAHGLGDWMDSTLPMRRPALVTDAMLGVPLSQKGAAWWRQEAWQLIPKLLAMVMVTPSGERAPHRNIKGATILLDEDSQLHLVDPGVEVTRASLEDAHGFDLLDRSGDPPWLDGETVTVTTFAAYPTFPPGTPGADMQAIGLMVYEGLTGTRPLCEDCPAPRSYNFGNGPEGRGVPAPKILVGEIPTLHRVDSGISKRMSNIVHRLLWAPCGHELALGHGRAIHEWADKCRAAAEGEL